MLQKTLIEVLRSICGKVEFQPGEYLFVKGQHYREMYILESGKVDVQLQAATQRHKISSQTSGAPIGEIGFLCGTPAIADAIASTPVTCLKIDDHILERLNFEHSEAGAELLRSLVDTMENRQSHNLTMLGGASLLDDNKGLQMLLCHNNEMQQKAFRLRYEVYCEELGRAVSCADEKRRLLQDELDEFGHTFIAVRGDEVVGSIRANRSTEGNLGSLVELYGMNKSGHHPATTGIVTKLVVKKTYRKSPVAMSMIAAICRYGVRHGITEIYVDSIAQLLHYYRAMGFVVSGDQFLHPDNGPSTPLKIDFAKYGPILGKEPTKLRLLSILVRAKFHKFMLECQRS